MGTCYNKQGRGRLPKWSIFCCGVLKSNEDAQGKLGLVSIGALRNDKGEVICSFLGPVRIKNWMKESHGQLEKLWGILEETLWGDCLWKVFKEVKSRGHPQLKRLLEGFCSSWRKVGHWGLLCEFKHQKGNGKRLWMYQLREEISKNDLFRSELRRKSFLTWR